MINKRGITTFEFIMWIPRLMFLVAISLIIIVFVRSYVNITTDISELEARSFVYRLVYSPHSLSYTNSMGRVYPGVISLEKFESPDSQKVIEENFHYGEPNEEVGAEFELDYVDEIGSLVSKQMFYNKDFFEQKEKLFEAGFTEGPGGVREYKIKYNVVVMLKNNELGSGFLTIKVAIPNS